MCKNSDFIHNLMTEKKPWTHLNFRGGKGDDFNFAIIGDRSGRPQADYFEQSIQKANMLNPDFIMSVGDFIRGISVDGDLTNISLTLNDCSVDFTDASAHDWAYAVNVAGGSGYVLVVNGGTYEGANVINVRGAGQTVVGKNATLTSLYLPSVYESMYGACIYVVQNETSSVEAVGNIFNGGNAVAINAGYTPVVESDNVNNTTRSN